MGKGSFPRQRIALPRHRLATTRTARDANCILSLAVAFAINLKVAKALGPTAPISLRGRASELIE